MPPRGVVEDAGLWLVFEAFLDRATSRRSAGAAGPTGRPPRRPGRDRGAGGSSALSLRLTAVRHHAWAHRTPAILDLIVGYRTLTAELRPGAASAGAVRRLVEATREAAATAPPARRVALPVVYGDAADREALEAGLGLRWPEIVALHAGGAYRVAFLGFTPGFGYLHGLPAPLALPRRAAPVALPAGAVAVADGRAGVYPSAGPGGWWVLGTTQVPLFDPWRAEPTALLPGDEVRFVASERGDAAVGATSSAPPPPQRPSPAPAIAVLEVWPGGASLQGRPRPGVGHLGMAQAGALDPRAFASAARLAGAPLDAPALEFAVPHATLRAERALTAAWAGGGARLRLEGRSVPNGRPFAWPAGALLEVRPDAATAGAHALLAVGGGLTPATGPVGHRTLVGAGSTDVRAGVGGFGRALAAGDALASASTPLAPDPRWSGRLRHAASVALRLHPGPHGEAAAYAALLATTFRLATRDRMGARLDGPAIRPERPDVASEGVPLGAVQLPADGRPIVLLADRGRTGGYALAGVVDPRDLPALSQLRPGGAVVFEPHEERRPHRPRQEEARPRALRRDHAHVLRRFPLIATSTTGQVLKAKAGLDVERFLSGPEGGDLQVGARIARTGCSPSSSSATR
jgi:KipI family sensor histidine kinase inhibitor